MWYQQLTKERNFIEESKLKLRHFIQTEKGLKFSYKILINIQYLIMCLYWKIILKRLSYGKIIKRNS
jgi:hypothetical protein